MTDAVTGRKADVILDNLDNLDTLDADPHTPADTAAKPRLLYLINCLEVGGAEIGLANLIHRRVFDEFELIVFTVWPSNPHFLAEFPEVAKCLRGSLIGRTTSRGALDLLEATLTLRTLVRSIAPGIIVASLPQAAVIARVGNWLARRRRPVVTFEHTVQLRSRFAAPLMRATTRANTGVIADSDATLHEVRHRHGYRSRTPSYILPLQDIESCLAAPLPSFGGDRLKLVFVGRLVESKNLHNLLAGVQVARSAGVPIDLTILGGGPLRDELEQRAVALGLSEVVSFGGIRYAWTRELAGQDVFGVLVSRQEGLSITSLQFLALGCPLITTAVGEIATYARHRANAFVTEDASSDAIAHALQSAWKQRERWPAMSVRARQSAADFNANGESAHTPQGFSSWLSSLIRRSQEERR